MTRRSRSLAGLVLACAALLLLPAAGSAALVPAKLRVEGSTRALDFGTYYANDTADFRTETPAGCGGSGRVRVVRNATALGILDYADNVNRRLRPVSVSDRFEFGLFVCGIGRFQSTGASSFWLYKVNHRAETVGADRRRLRANDQVLWYFVDTATGRNTGQELELIAPPRTRSGNTFTVQVYARDDAGNRTPASGATILGADEETTDASGRARIRLDGEGVVALRAIRGNDIRSEQLGVCVSGNVANCPSIRGETIVTTNRSERIGGTRGADTIFSRGGNDTVNVRGGNPDVVRCGRGRDTVFLSANDVAARDCERVFRR